MNSFAVATKTEIEYYRKSSLCHNLCGEKPFGSRHWEYPWALERSGLLKKKNQHVLDIAPDLTFPYSRFLENVGHRVTFIDLEKKQWSDKVFWGIDATHAVANFHVMDVRRMSFPDETFDTIFCISVLEHIVCPTQDPYHPQLHQIFDPLAAIPALKEMRRCLKTGGRLILTVDHYGGPIWSSLFARWNIFSDIAVTGLMKENQWNFDFDHAYSDPDTFISEFHGPYITLGFCLEK
jgi:SAM-dependent methyltransferase